MQLQQFKKYKKQSKKTFYRLSKESGVTAAQLKKLFDANALIDIETGDFYIKSKSKLKLIEDFPE